MPRLNIPLSVSIQFDNPVQPPAYGAAAIIPGSIDHIAKLIKITDKTVSREELFKEDEA